MKLAVVGAGTMGAGLVQLFAQSSAVDLVAWKVSSLEKGERAQRSVKKRWESLLEKGKISRSDLSVFQDKVKITVDYRDLGNSDLVVEAVAEQMAVKRIVFKEISDSTHERTILASNTSSLSITEIASVTKNPANVIGLHFFNPAPVMALTEIVSGILTSEETRQFAYDFSVSLGKKPVFVNEAPGFVVNRMLIPMINEAIGVLAEGVASAEDIDAAMCNGANHPIGPLALADLIGNDVCLSIMEVLHTETGDPKYRAHPLLRKMVRGGLLGRKTRQGFYAYPA